ncbi:hypothetical protein ACIBTP_20200 [Streptomyces avidinii]|uniref:hypothetical protein n=1 Tax=Streptomyces avidinii TaxID=1895 RepID=UPI00378FEC94
MTDALTDAARNYWVDVNTQSYEPLRARALGGRNMASVIEATVDALVEHGIDRSWIQVGRDAYLPGSFGLGNTRWDILIAKRKISSPVRRS